MNEYDHMNAMRYTDKLWDIFTNDPELVSLLEVDPSDEGSYAVRFRQEDTMPEEFKTDNLPFIAFYVDDAYTTRNDFVNKGLLYIDIYTALRDEAVPIRARIVALMHESFEGHAERVRAEGQRASGIVNVYKYRLEFTPLIST